MEAKEQLKEIFEKDRQSRDTHHHPNKSEKKGHPVHVSEKGQAEAHMVLYNGKHHSYYVLTIPGMAEKWKHDKSINLLDVVESFQILKVEQDGVKPTTGELESEFGTSNLEQACRRLLELGEVHQSTEKVFPTGNISTSKEVPHERYVHYKDVTRTLK